VQDGHASVLLAESLELLTVRPGGVYVDGTVGLGGHAAAILERSGPDGRLLGLDRDAEALERAGERLRPFADRVRLEHADYRDIPRLLGRERADGILLDLGTSSFQLDTAERGFSFRSEGPLDMRMDRSGGETAADVVNRAREADLADILYRFGEERASRRIARAIVAARRQARIRTTTELAAIVRRAAGRGRPGLDPATRTFQALRIHVNRELEGLGAALAAIAECLAPRGRMAVIAFHSLEDREVKHTFRELGTKAFLVLTRRPIRPGPQEVSANPRSRSARLRGLERPAA
jgi:16S rRNA (cytosine1402-N4)-methyltransferase